MLASMTQDTLIDENDSIKEKLSPPAILFPTLSTLEPENFHYLIQQQYGACWGTFKFEDFLGNYPSEGRPFLYVDDNIDLHVLHHFMINEWKLQTANIVIPILSSSTRHKPFKNLKIVEPLKKGIRNVINASQVWFITNGLDIGVPKLIGSAFRDEISLRRAEDTWAKQMDRAPKEHKTLILIGIVCDDDIKDSINFHSTKDKLKMEIKVPQSERAQLSLNSDHTHFIIICKLPIGSSSTNISEIKPTTIDTDNKLLEKITDSTGNVTNKFRNRFEAFLHQEALQQQIITPTELQSITTNSLSTPLNKSNSWSEDGFPMVCTLVHGTPETIELVYRTIQQEIPIVVLKGTGSAADLISFAYEEINTKNKKISEDDYFKVELTQCLVDEYLELKDNYLKRNEIRNYIMSIVKEADKKGRKFLSFIDINSTAPSLNDFHKFILSALLQGQKTVTDDKVNVESKQNVSLKQIAELKRNAQIKQNLQLTLDWNLPDLALSEIFQRYDDMKYSIEEELFDQAILKKNHETFVDLFLDREFVLHRYLNSDKFISLFNRPKDKDFLIITSLEGILSLTGDEEEVPKDFVDKGLNKIVKRLTGINRVFCKSEMDNNAMGFYFDDKSDKDVQKQNIRAEEKALQHLIIYAILMNRKQLAKILWKHSSEPIPLALICYMMFRKLQPYCHESYLSSLIEKQAKEFSNWAVGILDKSFNEDNQRTFEMLDEKHPDWNYMTTIELAYHADNKEFMAHPVCQKWVIRQFYGEITPRELSWGLFTCPKFLKIILSAILVFPMWFWINFSPIGQVPSVSKKASDLSNDTKNDAEIESKLGEGKKLAEQIDEVNVRQGNDIFQRLIPRLDGSAVKKSKTTSHKKQLNLFEKIKILWSAPITKFYTNFVCYIAFLCFFTLAVIWPSCGNLRLDFFVWFCAASITFENMRVTYEKYCSRSSLPLRRSILEIIVQIIFLALFLGFRIVGLWHFGTCQIVASKAILGVGLIYYYYRLLFIFLPINSKLGPLMIRLRYMITDDFFTFLQLFLIFMISSGVAITAVVYPHHSLNLDLFSKAFLSRGFMALFSSDMADLKQQQRGPCSINATIQTEREYACLRLSNGPSFKYDNPDAYEQYGIPSRNCNQTSWIAWFLLIQYFFLAKRFLTSLLVAMFGLTGARVQSQSQQIWLYNRYEILMEYAKRPCLPPPFIVISYIIMLITSCSSRCLLKLKEHTDKKNYSTIQTLTQSIPTAKNNDAKTDEFKNTSNEVIQNRSIFQRLFSCEPCQKNADKHNWKNDETNVYWKYQAKEFYAKTQEADKVQEKSKNLSKRTINMQKDIDILRKSLRHVSDRVLTSEKLLIDSQILLEKIHSIIKQEDKSLPIYPKFIHMLSRESPYIYTNEARFPITERHIPWKVSFDLYDPTVISLPKQHNCFQDSERLFVEPDLAIEPSVTTMTDITTPLIDYKWNQVVESQLPDGKKIIIDRTTWIVTSEDKTSSFYRLDNQLSIPLNPMGRTGVRGRGALIRWGPNKSIIAVITRWKKHHDQFTVIDGQRILETLVFKDKYTNDWKLPEAKILGIESRYGAICRSFHELAFKDNDSEHSFSFEENDMIKYFESFARVSISTFETTGFESHMAYQGYIDDLRNTDNAWVETEIWNFHYDSNIPFPNLRQDGVAIWKDVTNNFRGFLIQTSMLREITRIHQAFFK
ncbi:unnamed protein product [Rotaria sordida]|uniref:Uncharacterized protein n=1 Tax=Rotaria sordida TaxID=392033 RepID=A0A815BAP0_9BILA|nr:unnamed protein product [Rotaria sordida]